MKFYRKKNAINVCHCINGNQFMEVRTAETFSTISTGTNPFIINEVLKYPEISQQEFMNDLKSVSVLHQSFFA